MAYRGRLAPSPTGYLHLGHALTFWAAAERARMHGGELILRMDDLDRSRSRPEFVDGALEDLRWFGFSWSEGPDCGGAFGPYSQSARMDRYAEALANLVERGFLFPCRCSRKDILSAIQAPHAADEEPVYPGTCRERVADRGPATLGVTWRFRVPDGERIGFVDRCRGAVEWIAGRDFGDFVVWRQDGVPGYQLACVVDDAAMRITEVVRGEDLLLSTARQLLLYRALGLTAPDFHHGPLMTDEKGVRLAKRHAALGLRQLRESGRSPEELRRLPVFQDLIGRGP
jgi:glutamyl-tRNA synthetase